MAEREWNPANVFDLFGDSLARRILVLASDSPVSTNELVDRLDVSPPTVYRRVNELLDHDFVTEHWRIDDDGNQYRVFETTLDRVEFQVDDGGYNVEVKIRQSLTDQFEGFWSELERARANDRFTSSEGGMQDNRYDDPSSS